MNPAPTIKNSADCIAAERTDSPHFEGKRWFDLLHYQRLDLLLDGGHHGYRPTGSSEGYYKVQRRTIYLPVYFYGS